MEDVVQLSCCLCSSPYYPVKIEEEDENDTAQNCFLSFLAELKLKGNSHFSLNETAVCAVCFCGIRQAMSTKRKVDGVESHVIELQGQMLGAMRQLESLLHQFYEDMRWIEKVVKNSSSNVESVECQSNRRKYKRDVLVFRKSIIEVVGSLEGYKTDLARKNMSRVVPIGDVDESKAPSYSGTPDEDFPEYSHSDGDDNLDEDFHIPMDNDDDDDNESYQEAANDRIDLDFVKEEGIPTSKHKNINTARRERKKQNNPVDSDSTGKIDVPTCSRLKSESRDSAGNLKDRVNFRIKDKKKLLLQLARKYDIRLSGMSKWKRTSLWRLLRIATSVKIPTKCSNGKIKLCEPTKQYDCGYDSSSGQLLFANYPILLKEAEEKVICNHCGYEVKSSDPNVAPRYIIEHILGNHLEAYTCEECGVGYKSSNKFRKHLNSHLNAVTCKICGKPLSTPEYVRTHLWTHMSKEEREEAIRNGEKDRLAQWTAYKDYEKTCVCSVCGTSFKTSRQLKKHEQVHMNVEERPKYLCPHCGKLFLRTDTLQKHMEKVCSVNCKKEDLSTLFSCDLCPVTFKTKTSYKNHRKNAHGILREENYSCTMCPHNFAGYPTKTSLLIHIKKVHEGKKVYVCPRDGCGKEFIKKSKFVRHLNAKKCANAHNNVMMPYPSLPTLTN